MLTESPSLPDERWPSNETTTLRQWAAVAAVTVGAFAFVTTEFLPMGLLPLIAHTLNVLPGTAGLMVTIPAIMAAISAPGLMLVAGRMDRRHVFLWLTAMLLASNLLSAFAPNFGIMLVGRALLGAALGGFWTLATAAAVRLVAPRHAPKAMAAILSGVTCATVIGVPLGTFIAGFASWRVSFMVTAGLVAIALLAQFCFVPSLPSAVALRFSDLTDLLKRSHARRSLLMVALAFGGHFASYTYISSFLLGAAHFDLSMITWLLLGFGIIGFFSNFVASATVVRNLKVTTAGMIGLLALSLLLMPLLHQSHIAVSVILLMWGVAFGAMPLCFSVWIQRATPEHPEAGSALFVGIIQVAIAAGSFVGGAMVDHVGVSGDFVLGGLMSVCGVIALASASGRVAAQASKPASEEASALNACPACPACPE